MGISERQTGELSMLKTLSFPPELTDSALTGLVREVDGRETVLQAIIQRFEQRYGSLEQLEARLETGMGSEHPDWEDSIEWRNAAEVLRRAQIMRSLFEWLQSSTRQLASS